MSENLGRFVASISGVLRPDEPIERVPLETAAVAVIAREGTSGEEVLLIRRSERDGDPWSGQVALPGGRVERNDASFRDTAVRESSEETGIELGAARFLGYLGAFQARTRSIRVVPSVFIHQGELSLRLNQEVSSFRWVPFASLVSQDSRTIYRLEWDGKEREFPAFELDGFLVWGLTERILTSLVDSIVRYRKNSG